MGQAPRQNFQDIKCQQLRVGTRLQIPIYDNQSILLLAAGQIITPGFLEKLTARGVDRVKVHRDEIPRLFAGTPQGMADQCPKLRGGIQSDYTTISSRSLDRELRRPDLLQLPTQGQAYRDRITNRDGQPYDDALKSRFVDTLENSVTAVDEVYHSLSKESVFPDLVLTEVVENCLHDLFEDWQLCLALGINPHDQGYPARHSMHTAMLACSIGLQLGLDEPTLKELAIGCLIHDVGMLKIEENLFRDTKTLTDFQFMEVTKHPVKIFDTLRDIDQIPKRSAYVAYQIHERCNGSGYPRGCKGSQIHFLAKIAGVADSFIGLVSPRPHREGLQPYFAMERMIRGVADGLYESVVVRAMLEAVSLFPIGSFVTLSNGQHARILRTNGKNYMNPVVQLPTFDGGWGDILDLGASDGLRIARSLPQMEWNLVPAMAEFANLGSASSLSGSDSPEEAATPTDYWE